MKTERRNVRVRPIFKLRARQGEYNNLVQKMRLRHTDMHFEYFWMMPEPFDSFPMTCRPFYQAVR